MTREIRIEGAKQNNLKDISLSIPHDQLIIICGPSGSGKSTLAFDIIYAEGQRRYVESLSAYARQFLDKMEKPLVDKIDGLSPAISLEQQTIMRNPRSTVATTTELYDFLRVFYARLGIAHCPECGKAIESLSIDEMVNEIMLAEEGSKYILLAPIVLYQKGSHQEIIKRIQRSGFVRIRLNGDIVAIEDVQELDKNKKHCIDIVVDRIVIKDDMRSRVASSIETVLKEGNGTLIVHDVDTNKDRLFSTSASCVDCKISLPNITPQLFSFNSPQGACPTCLGIGLVEQFTTDLLVPNKTKSISSGAILPLRIIKLTEEQNNSLEDFLRRHNITRNTPFNEWSEEITQRFFHGDKKGKKGFLGLIPLLEKEFRSRNKLGEFLSIYQSESTCPDCNGARLRKEALSITIQGLSLYHFTRLSISKAITWFSELSFTGRHSLIAEPLVKEIEQRLAFMSNVGLEYLTLDRTMTTLSGGEAQRIRLASQLGSGLVGVTYVLDEPSIGLHPKDNDRLIATLRDLQKKGNTVIVVEHDESTIRESDYIIEMGPHSGLLGGELIYSGSTKEFLHSSTSLTAQYLRGERSIAIPEKRRLPEKWILAKNIQTHNIQTMDCEIPLGLLICATGVSGSGKSSLVVDTLYKNIALKLGLKVDMPGLLDSIEGLEEIEKIVLIDQSPIGRTPRSNPATYTKIFDEIRTVFSLTPQARKMGYGIGRFSFNVAEGRCGVCNGEGELTVEMHFLPDIHVPCDICEGKRYNKETLSVEYKGKNIADVLSMTVSEACEFFQNYPNIERRLRVLEEVGLGYIHLGQSATTLSGGEAQRIKISKELGKKRLPKTLYILDEPTTGLHMHEIGKLIHVLHTLVNYGATVLVIEHNTDVIMASDYILDLGPGGGEYGGKIIAKGSPEEIMANPESTTGFFLTKEMNTRRKKQAK
ncbi:MAG: excinuclease ABC subunit UvrA [Desulfovibrionaceae bacterium]